jgi:F-type H+-transporting ATPase subunit delta
MRSSTIARNYAEALLALARKANDLEGWGASIRGVVSAIEGDERLRNFLAAPQVSADQKRTVIGKAFADRLPAKMVRFIQKLIENRRQMLLPEIAIEYGNLVDEATGRIHANVMVAREASEADLKMIAAHLSRAFSKVVIPHVTVKPEIIGGVIVKVGDQVMDGSVRKRLRTLRSRVLAAKS